MAVQTSHKHPQPVNRRRFLRSGMATVASTGIALPFEQADAAGRVVVHIGPPERPRSDIEAWNVGLISARRPELTPAENLIPATPNCAPRFGNALAYAICAGDT